MVKVINPRRWTEKHHSIHNSQTTTIKFFWKRWNSHNIRKRDGHSAYIHNSKSSSNRCNKTCIFDETTTTTYTVTNDIQRSTHQLSPLHALGLSFSVFWFPLFLFGNVGGTVESLSSTLNLERREQNISNLKANNNDHLHDLCVYHVSIATN